MYKKLIGIAAVAAMAAGIYFITNTGSSEDNNVDLASLLKVNNANAECMPWGDASYDGGLCLSMGASVYCLSWYNARDCDGSQP